MIGKSLCVVVAGLMLAGGVARAQGDQRPGVAVLPFTNSAIGKANEELGPLSKGIPEMMLEELSANKSLRVVERDALQKILDEQNLARDGRVDPGTAAKLGKIVGAAYMMAGSFVTDTRGTMVLTMKVFDATTSELKWSGTETGKVEGLLSLIAKAAAKATKGLNLPPMPPAQQEAQLKKAEKQDLPIKDALLFARALEAKDSGKKAEAVAMFKQVLSKFPSFELASKELKSLDGK